MLRLACLALAFGAVAVAAPVPKDTKPQLLIVTKKGVKSQLTLMNEDGSNAKELTDEKSNASYPAWSPDGKRIAFSSDRDGGVMHLFAMDADGTNVTQLTKGQFQCRVPSWTPDGKQVAYCRATDQGSSEIVVADAAGENAKVVGTGDGWDPAFSPDGKSVAFVSTRDFGGFRLYTMDADGKNAKRLVDTGNNIGFAYPAWSPDGKRIAFGHIVNGKIELHAIDADGGITERVTKFGGVATYPAWSNDGKRLAFIQYQEVAKAELVVMDPDGKNAKVLLKDLVAVEGGRPVWRPKK